MMLEEIYTFGYGNCASIDPLLFLLKKYNIDLVIDVRVKPRAWTTKWSAPYLQKQLGKKYISIPELGNTTGTSTWLPPSWLEANQKLDELCNIGRSIVLICSEKDYRQCHRTEVAKKLVNITNARLKHLFADEALAVAV